MNTTAGAETVLPRVSKQAKARPDLGALTGLRFFAAFYVVLYHFLSPNLHTNFAPLGNLLSVGYSAVGLFFLLSGFVLSYSYIGEDKKVDRSRFWKARFSRIYPAYLFAFLLAAPFQVWGSLHVNSLRVAAEKLTLGALLVLTLLQSWTPWTAWYWNIPAWSLSAEVFFYFCFPFLALLVVRLRPRKCLAIAAGTWLAGMIIPAVYCISHSVAAQPPFPMPQLAIETNPLLRLPEFFVGMLLGRIFTGGFRFSDRWASALSACTLIGVIALLSCSAAIPRLLLSNSILTPLYALFIFALAHQRGWLTRLLCLRPLRILGEASYAIYILQFPVSYILHLNNDTFSFARFLCYLAALIALSVLTFLFIEQPLRRRLSARNGSSTHSDNPSLRLPVTHRLTAKAWQL